MTIEETLTLSPKYDESGLIAAVAQDVRSKDILMLAWMNAEALKRTIESGEAWYWSRSRQELWHKGKTSGSTQSVKEIRIDCDQDAVILLVEQEGGACHTGRPSCFYRRIEKTKTGEIVLSFGR